jgi:hypothetical protein
MCHYMYWTWIGCGHEAKSEWRDCQATKMGQVCTTMVNGTPTARTHLGQRYYEIDYSIDPHGRVIQNCGCVILAGVLEYAEKETNATQEVATPT